MGAIKSRLEPSRHCREPSATAQRPSAAALSKLLRALMISNVPQITLTDDDHNPADTAPTDCDISPVVVTLPHIKYSAALADSDFNNARTAP